MCKGGDTMSEENKNGYDSAVNQLCDRFRGRGAAANVRDEAGRQVSAGREAPNAYFISRMDRGDVSPKFRSGEYNGKKYMTTGDFLEKYKYHRTESGADYIPHKPSVNTREFRKSAQKQVGRTDTTGKPLQEVQRRPAQSAAEYATRPQQQKSVRRFDPSADTIVMPAQKTTGKVKGRIRQLFAKWFPSDGEKKREDGKKKKNVPVAMIGFIVSVAAAMSMIVGTTVMSGEAQSRVGTLKSEIKSLEAERLRLEEELVKKDDLVMISTYAEEKLGMIRKDYVSSVYLPSAENDSVQATEKKDGKGLASLLSAIYGG